MQERDERLDALLMEARILFSIWNYQITYSLSSPNVPFEQIAVTISQEAFRAELGDVGARTFERSCKRLVEMGRLYRERPHPRAVYTYHVSEDAYAKMMLDLLLSGTVMVQHDEHNRILRLEVNKERSIIAAGVRFDEFFG